MWTWIGVYQILGQDSQSSHYWKRNLHRDTCGPGGHWPKILATARPENVWPEAWTKIGKATQKRENQSSTTFADWEEFTLSIQLTKSTKTFSRKRGESWIDCGYHAAKQCVVVVWNLMSPRGNERNFRSPNIMKITLQEKDLLRCLITIWCTNLFLCHKQWRYWMPKPQWARNGKNSWRSQHGIVAKVKSKKEVFWKHKETKRKSTLPHGWTCVTSKKLSWNQSYRSTKAESGSSASQMTAAKIMDVIARLPGCDGQAAHAVSAFAQEKLEDAPRLQKIPKSECPDVWMRLPRHKWPKSWESMEDPVVPLERNLYGHPLAGLFWERQFAEALLELGWENVPNWKQGLVLSASVDDIKMAGKKQNMAPTWKTLMKKRGHWRTQHFFLTMKTLVVLCVTAIRMKQLLNSGKGCLNLAFLLEQHKNYRAGKTSRANRCMDGHAQKCVEPYCKLAHKKVEQLYTVSSPCLDDHQFKLEELEPVGELSEFCSQIVSKCLYLARIGRPDILWSVNKLARSVTEWSQACDRRQARLIRGQHTRWNLAPRKMRPQRSTGHGAKCLQAQKYGQNYVLLSSWSQGNAGAHFETCRRTWIRGWLRSINAHAEQKGVKLRRNGDSVEIQEHHNSGNGQRGSANKRGSTSFRSRSWSLPDGANTWWHACSGPVSKTTSAQEWEKDSVQDGKLRTSYCPWIVVKFWYQFAEGLVKHIFKSSIRAKWRTRSRTKIKRRTVCETFKNG